MVNFFPIVLSILGLGVRGYFCQPMATVNAGYPLISDAPPLPPIISEAGPIILTPKPEPIPTVIRIPPYVIFTQTPTALAQLRRSVEQAQSGIEQIGTGNQNLIGNIQQIDIAGKRKSRKRPKTRRTLFGLGGLFSISAKAEAKAGIGGEAQGNADLGAGIGANIGIGAKLGVGGMGISGEFSKVEGISFGGGFNPVESPSRNQQRMEAAPNNVPVVNNNAPQTAPVIIVNGGGNVRRDMIVPEAYPISNKAVAGPLPPYYIVNLQNDYPVPAQALNVNPLGINAAQAAKRRQNSNIQSHIFQIGNNNVNAQSDIGQATRRQSMIVQSNMNQAAGFVVPVVASDGAVGYAYSPDGAQALHSDWFGLNAAQARRQNMNVQSAVSQRRQNMNAQSGVSQRRQNLNAQSDVSQGGAEPEAIAYADPAVAVAGDDGAYAVANDAPIQSLAASFFGGLNAVQNRRQNMNAQSGVSQRRQNMNAQTGISQRRQNLNAQSGISQGIGAEPEAVAYADPLDVDDGAYAIANDGGAQSLTSSFLNGLNAAQARRQNMNAQSQISQRRQNFE